MLVKLGDGCDIAPDEPRLDVLPQPGSALSLGELKRWRREVVVPPHVRRDAVLVRQAEEPRYVADIDQVVKIYESPHDSGESRYVDKAQRGCQEARANRRAVEQQHAPPRSS